MSAQDTTRREVIKKAVYATPVLLTLKANLTFAATGSGLQAPSDYVFTGGPGPPIPLGTVPQIPPPEEGRHRPRMTPPQTAPGSDAGQAATAAGISGKRRSGGRPCRRSTEGETGRSPGAPGGYACGPAAGNQGKPCASSCVASLSITGRTGDRSRIGTQARVCRRCAIPQVEVQHWWVYTHSEERLGWNEGEWPDGARRVMAYWQCRMCGAIKAE